MTQELTDDAKLKLLALDKEARVADLFEGFGSDERQRLLASKSFSDNFIWNGARLSFKLNGEEITATDPRVREHFQKQWEFLLPPYKTADSGNGTDNGDAITVDPTLVENALTSTNMTLRGKLVVSLNNNTDEANRLARSYGLRDIHDRRVGTKPADGSNGKANDDNKSSAAGGTKHKSSNPWSKEAWSEERQASVIRTLGTKKAAEIAAAAGRTISGRELPGAAA